MRALRIIWRDLTTPEDFRGDWYGWMTNKLSHISLGFMLAAIGAGAWLRLYGEFPPKGLLFSAIALGMAAFQFLAQGWQGWDTVEDWCFISIWGAGGTILVFTQVDPANGTLGVSIWPALIMFSFITTWLAFGIIYRIRERLDEVE